MQTIIRSAKRVARSIVTAGSVLAATTVGSEAEITRETGLSLGKITTGIHNQVPWSSHCPDSKAAGIVPALICATFEPFGVKEVEFSISDLAVFIPGLLAQRLDVAACGLDITSARCEQVAFCDADRAIGDALIVKGVNPYNLHSMDGVVAKLEDLLLESKIGEAIPNFRDRTCVRC